MNVVGKRKTSKGRRKITLEKIEKPAARYVSFTKRKQGLFTKASDLCTLCGTEVAVVVFSPVGRPYSFGCPDVERVVDRFLSSDPIPAAGSHAHRPGSVNHRVTELRKQIDAEKARKTVLRAQLTAVSSGLESLDSLDGLDVRTLDALAEMLLQIKTQATNRVVQILTGSGASSSYAGNFGPGGVQPMLNPVQPDPWASSSNAVTVDDHVGTSSLDWIANVHSIGQGWQGFQSILNPIPPIEEFWTDLLASSPDAATFADHAGTSGSGGIMNVDSSWQGFQSILNPIPPIEEFWTDLLASSPDAATFADHAGTSGSGGIMNVDSRWQGFQSILNPISPIKEFWTDPWASSPDEVITNDHVGNSSTIGIATVDSRWQSFQPVLNPVLPKEFLTDWRAFSPNAATVVDHTGTSGSSRNAIVDSIGQGFRSVPNPVQAIKEFLTDPSVSSPIDVSIGDHVSPCRSAKIATVEGQEVQVLSDREMDQKVCSSNGSGKMVIADSEWQGFQPVLNPVSSGRELSRNGSKQRRLA
ncbi:unnamed protein product [Musa acuminata subsp. malaccensis]|uniref:(wild Malaysian banana) hypothetical protein n=1 Tax=Musa acuminata subsp. malaccensis TaxID=214687 RepID=A0A8D6ZV46_MUSAM|nr:unnamed protein product [Musa acuminata subsp. malaccensis]